MNLHNNLEKKINYTTPYPIEYFFINTDLLVLKNNKLLTNLSINISNKDIYKFTLLNIYSLSLFYITLIDLYSVNLVKFKLVNYQFSSLLNDLRFNLNLYISLNSLFLYSIQTLIPCSTWCERELSEFTNIYLFNSLDSRKLLLDYSSKKMDHNFRDSNLNTYNSYFYDFYM